MPGYHVWQGLDRLSFFEAIILLEMKARSQGHPIKKPTRNLDEPPRSGGKIEEQKTEMYEDLCDDFALIASGAGGKENVSAVCVEFDDARKVLMLRVASNSGLQGRIEFLKNILKSVTKVSPEVHGMDTRRQDVMLMMLKKCKTRIMRKSEKLKTALKSVLCSDARQYSIPMWTPNQSATESADDKTLFGQYCEGNHDAYMRLCRERLERFNRILSILKVGSEDAVTANVIEITKLAYDVRRSGSFKRFLSCNVKQESKSNKRDFTAAILSNILERIGQISKFYRAAATITALGAKFTENDISIKIEAVSTALIKVPELQERKTAQIRQRGGPKFQTGGESMLQGMLNRWHKYREHAEIQLLIFYEEHSQLKPLINYIGCNKQACFLCYNLLKSHGQFKVNGCHQSLYALWTVPDIIYFANDKRAEVFKKALGSLCDQVDLKLSELKNLDRKRTRIGTSNESVANLSRESLALTNLVINAKAFRSSKAPRSDTGTKINVPTDLSSDNLEQLVTLDEEPSEALRVQQEWPQASSNGNYGPDETAVLDADVKLQSGSAASRFKDIEDPPVLLTGDETINKTTKGMNRHGSRRKNNSQEIRASKNRRDQDSGFIGPSLHMSSMQRKRRSRDSSHPVSTGRSPMKHRGKQRRRTRTRIKSTGGGEDFSCGFSQLCKIIFRQFICRVNGRRDL